MKKISFLLITIQLMFLSLDLSAQSFVNGGNNLSASGRLGTTSNQSLVFITNNSERGRITNGGNWGFGSTGTSSFVTVNSSSSVTPFRVQVGASTKFIVNTNGGVSIGSLSATPANGLYVSGDVGIGITSPAAKLHVTGSSTSGTAIYGIGYDYGVQGNVTNTYGTGVFGNSDHGYGVYGNSNYIGAFGYGGDGGYGTFGSSGYVGAYGGGSTYGVFGEGGTGVYGSGTTGIYAVSSISGGDGVLSSVSGSGNYGVNSYSANSYGLYAATGVSGGYAAYFNGPISVSGTYYGSDAKLKKNIVSVNNAMDIISKLKPKNYEFRNDGDFARMNLPSGKHYGFIAQDLEVVLPGLIKQTQFLAKPTYSHPANATPALDAHGLPVKPTAVAQKAEVIDKGASVDFKAVNYIELIPIMVKAMQEQEAKMVAMHEEEEAKIAALTALVNQLRDQRDAFIKSGTGSLGQNTPNPAVANSTRINYAVPSNSSAAELIFTDAAGKQIKQISLNKNGGYVDFNTSALSAGTYFYTLYINGKSLDTKKMVVSNNNY